MKTKIIYISGGEIFNMNDVRDAFDTVRRELGLGMDTIFFGVPVDSGDALNGRFDNIQPEQPATIVPDTTQDEIKPEITQENPNKTVKKRRTKKEVEISDIPTVQNIDEQPVQDSEETSKIIPILSVLGTDKPTDTIQDTVASDEIIAVTEQASDTEIDADLVSVSDDENPVIDATTSDNDIEFDETPEFAIKPSDDLDANDIDSDIMMDSEPQTTTIAQDADEDNQLEKLLESVRSLHEDKEEHIEPIADIEPASFDETDATLEKLATEFAENQDKIVNTTKSGARGGKIGKLKNILPFKKVKRNESSLMGDLFGWAGVAANDEEFGIPEFFPTAAKK